MSGVWDSTPALQCMSGRKSEEGNSGRAVENSLQPREMKVLGGGYLRRLTVPFGSGHPGKCYRTTFLRGDEGHHSGDPRGGDLHLETSQLTTCAREHLRSLEAGRGW